MAWASSHQRADGAGQQGGEGHDPDREGQPDPLDLGLREPREVGDGDGDQPRGGEGQQGVRHGAGTPGRAPQARDDGRAEHQQQRGEVAPGPVLVRAQEAVLALLVVPDRHLLVALVPPETGGGEGGDHGRGADPAGDQREDPAAQQRDGDGQEPGEHEPVGEEEREPEDDAREQAQRVPPEAAAHRAEREQRDAPGQDRREHPVRRDAHPDRAREQDAEGQVGAGEVAVAERGEGDRHRDHGGRPDRGRDGAGVLAAGEARAVEQDVEERRSGRVTGRVRHQGVRGLPRDPLGERLQEDRDVRGARDLGEVLGRRRQPFGDPDEPPVDRREGERPRQLTRRRPRRGAGPSGTERATAGPPRATTRATRTAGTVPGPTCGSHCASSGGQPTSTGTPASIRAQPTSAEAVTSSDATATARRSPRRRNGRRGVRRGLVGGAGAVPHHGRHHRRTVRTRGDAPVRRAACGRPRSPVRGRTGCPRSVAGDRPPHGGHTGDLIA